MMQTLTDEKQVVGYARTMVIILAVFLGWVGVCVGVGQVQAAVGAVGLLDMVSVDSPVVVVVPSMDGLSQKVGMLNDALGLGDPNLSDLSGVFRSQTGIQNGLDSTGAFLLVMPKLSDEFFEIKNGEVNDGDGPEFVVLLPVLDYAAFVGNFEGGDAAADVTKVEFRNGRESFVKSIGGYAVMGEAEEVVRAYTPGNQGAAMWEKAGGLNGKYLGKSDAWVMANVYLVSDRLVTLIDGLMASGKAKIARSAEQKQGHGGGGMDVGVANLMFEMYGPVAKRIVTDATVVSFSIDVNDVGIGVNYVAQFSPESYLGKIFPKGTSASSLLSRLPSKPYLLAMAVNLTDIDFKTLVSDMLEKLSGEGDQVEASSGLTAIYQRLLPLIEKTLGSATVYYAPKNANMFGGGLFTGLSVIETLNGKDYVAAMRAYMESMDGFSMPLMGVSSATGDPRMMTFSTTYTADALQVEGRSVDMYEIQYNFPPELMGQMGPMFMMMGGQGQQGYIAANEDFVVMTTSPDALLIQTGLNAVEQQVGIGSDGPIVGMREGDALTSNAMLETYISVPGIMSTTEMLVAGFTGGQGLGVEIPADLAPIAVSASVVDSGVVGRYYIETKTLRTIVETVYSIREKFAAGRRDGGSGQPMQPGGPSPGHR